VIQSDLATAGPAAVTRRTALFDSKRLYGTVAITLAWRFAIALWGAYAHYLNPPLRRTHSLMQHGWPANPITYLVDTGIRNDALWYARIALHGYFYSSVHVSSIGFYPLYPLLIRLAIFVVGNVFVAGMLVSLFALLAAVVVFDSWMGDHGLNSERRRALLLLLAFPTAMFYSYMYSESLYLLLAIACFVAFERRRSDLSTVVAFLLVLTRPTGLVIVPALILIAGLPHWRRWLAPVAGAVAAAGAFALYQWREFGTALAYVNAKAVPPWHDTASQAVSDLMLHGRPGMPPSFLAFNLLIALPFVVSIPFVYRRFGPGYAVFVGLSIILSAYGTLPGMNRYVIVLFPVFALWGSIRPRALAALLPLLLVSQAFFVDLWVKGIGIF